MPRILLVEDDPQLTRVLATFLTRRGNDVATVSAGDDALAQLSSDAFDLLITDLNLPGDSGIQLLHQVKRGWSELAVILMTGSTNPDHVIEALHGGADRYLIKPFALDDLANEVEQALRASRERHEAVKTRSQLETDLRQRNAEVRSLILRGVTALAQAVEAKDQYTHGHAHRVTQYALIIASVRSGIDLDALLLGGELHDIGKIGVPDAVLNKSTSLTSAEYAKIQEHPIIGRRILEALIDNEDILALALSHHERWDGGGYPNGLAGTAIPLIVRILSVADVLDAMTSSRAYRAARGWSDAVAEIRRGANGQFDPGVVEMFLSVLPLLESKHAEFMKAADSNPVSPLVHARPDGDHAAVR
jgi:putative two-component system response regulator